jgi:hypothetical protein
MTMARLRLRYVQSFGGYHYFRRRGVPRIALPGIVGSAEFMAAYQQALAAAPAPIGKSLRCGPGSVSAALAEYYGSQAFRSLTGGTPAKRRAILEREQYGDRPLASLPREFVVALLDTMPPHAAGNWLASFRHFFAQAPAHRSDLGHSPQNAEVGRQVGGETARRERLHRARDRRHYRACQPQGSRALHKGRRPGSARARRDGENGDGTGEQNRGGKWQTRAFPSVKAFENAA